jgi:D-alanine-D-alanine ligase
MSNLRVAILVPPDDREATADRADTFIQAEQITECLKALGNTSLTMFFGDDAGETARQLIEAQLDVVVNLVEDVPEGPDQIHLATALLDRLNLPYTGAPTATLAILGDKRQMKRRLQAGGLPVAPALEDGNDDTRFIIKSAIEHASIGIDAESIAIGRHAAERLIAERRTQFGGPWFAEAYIEGREFNVGILQTLTGPLPLPVAEILFLNHADGRPKIVGYEEKWAEGSAAYDQTPRTFAMSPADLSLKLALTQLALAAWQLFELKGYARVDFRVDDRGNPYILEVNANPCLSADAGFCAAAHEAGMTQTDIVAHLIETALG